MQPCELGRHVEVPESVEPLTLDISKPYQLYSLLFGGKILRFSQL